MFNDESIQYYFFLKHALIKQDNSTTTSSK